MRERETDTNEVRIAIEDAQKNAVIFGKANLNKPTSKKGNEEMQIFNFILTNQTELIIMYITIRHVTVESGMSSSSGLMPFYLEG